jgi:hypothetical protein
MTGPRRPELDDLLATWAQARRLPDAEADRILRAIIPAVPAPSMTWWAEFNDKLSSVIIRATAAPLPAFADPW